MAKHRTHSVEFKQQVSQEYLSGETLHALAKRHDISRNLIRIWVEKFQAGALCIGRCPLLSVTRKTFAHTEFFSV
jgi:transposase-like protein